MRNVCALLVVFMFMSPAFAAGKATPDLQSRLPACREDLNPGEPRPGYVNSFEEDRARQEPGPDEVDDRNPDERDARDPGGF